MMRKRPLLPRDLWPTRSATSASRRLYNALSTYFVVYVTNSLFSGVDKAVVAGKLIGIITSLIVIIRIAEIFVDPLLGNLVDNTTTKLRAIPPLAAHRRSGVRRADRHGLHWPVRLGQRQHHAVHRPVRGGVRGARCVLPLRDISYWGMIPSISSDSHQRGIYTAAGTFTGSLGYNGLDYRRDAHRHLLQLRCRPAEPEWLDRVHHHRGPARRSHGSECSARCQGKQSTLRTKAQENGNPIEAFRALIHNDQLMWTALSYVFYAVANVATGGVMVYLFKYVIGRMDLFPVTGVIPIACGLIMSVLFPVITRWVPRRYLFLIGMSVMVVAYLLLIVASTNIPLLVALVLFYLPQTQIQMTVIVCLEDSIEYGQLKNRQTQRSRDAVRASDARQDRRRILQRLRRLRGRGRRHDRFRHRRRHDGQGHHHLQDLRLHDSAGVHCAWPDCVRDFREDDGAAQCASGRQAHWRILRRLAMVVVTTMVLVLVLVLAGTMVSIMVATPASRRKIPHWRNTVPELAKRVLLGK